MKSIKKLALAILAIFTIQATVAQKSEWKELKDFHGVMSKTFHPAEEGNLQPLKDNSTDLVAKSKTWQASAIPTDYKKEETQKVLINLVAKCEEVDKAVKAKKSDADLKKLINEAHEIFHQLVEKCRNPETKK
ncbi:MAG: hypothetical protein ABI388_09900 [Bacteroidia bacterium]